MASSMILPGSKIGRVGGERSPRRVLDPLVDGQDRDVSGSRDRRPWSKDLLQVAEDLGVSVGLRHYAGDIIRTRKVELVFREALGLVGQEVLGFMAQ